VPGSATMTGITASSVVRN